MRSMFAGAAYRPILLAFGVIVLPVVCTAQDGASFGDMTGKVRAGQVVIVTEPGGQTTAGKVVEVSKSSLVVLAKDQSGRWTSRREFQPAAVREVKRTGPIWDKAALGAGIGVATGLGVEDCTGCLDRGAWMLMAAGIGAGIGFGFDVAFGPKRIYRAPAGRTAALKVAPMLGATHKGVAFAVAF